MRAERKRGRGGFLASFLLLPAIWTACYILELGKVGGKDPASPAETKRWEGDAGGTTTILKKKKKKKGWWVGQEGGDHCPPELGRGTRPCAMSWWQWWRPSSVRVHPGPKLEQG